MKHKVKLFIILIIILLITFLSLVLLILRKSDESDSLVKNAKEKVTADSSHIRVSTLVNESSRTVITNNYSIIKEKNDKSDFTSQNNTDSFASQYGANANQKDDIIAELNSVFLPLSNSGGEFCLDVVSLDGDKNFHVGSNDEEMVSASLIKLFVAATAYQHYDNLKDFEEYSGETEHLINIMISNSDNEACNILVTRLGNGNQYIGMNIVNGFCSTNGFLNTKMNRLMLDFNGLENYTTTSDCCKILQDFYNNKFFGSKSIISYMKSQATRTKIPSGINDGTVVANKTGELATVENDAAIIYADNSPYVICIMTNGVSDNEAVKWMISKSTELVHSYMRE